MFTLPVGFVLLILALLFSTPLSSWGTYVNTHSLFIVLGGTIAITGMALPWSILKMLGRMIQEVFHKEDELGSHECELEELSTQRRLNSPSKNPLINYATELWDNGTSQEMFVVLISQRREALDSQRSEAVQGLKNLSKYPPALGMTGTVMGLVVLFSNLGSDNKDSLGPALGMAMTATFFGLIIANAVLMPLADRLHVQHMKWRAHNQSIYELLLLVNRKEPLTLIQGEVKDRVAAAA